MFVHTLQYQNLLTGFWSWNWAYPYITVSLLVLTEKLPTPVMSYISGDLQWLRSLESEPQFQVNQPEMSTDDLGWICSWGGDPLIKWENCSLAQEDVVQLVDYWLWKEAVHVRLSDILLDLNIEVDPSVLHQYVQQIRMQSDLARWRGMSHSLPP